MAKIHNLQLHMPNEMAWGEIKRDCKLSAEQAVALWSTLEEAVGVSEAQSRGPTSAEIKKALTKVDNALERLALTLRQNDVTVALRAIETYGLMGHLLSATAAVQLTESDDELSANGIEGLLRLSQLTRAPIRASTIDALALADRQRRLSHQTPEAMNFVVRQLRQPISAWLLQARQDKGGNRLNSDREMLIFLLARDASKFIERKPNTKGKQDFMSLCTHVLVACGIDDQGLEDAVARCLKKYKGWTGWSKLPEHKLEIQALSDEQAKAIPTDEGGPLS